MNDNNLRSYNFFILSSICIAQKHYSHSLEIKKLSDLQIGTASLFLIGETTSLIAIATILTLSLTGLLPFSPYYAAIPTNIFFIFVIADGQSVVGMIQTSSQSLIFYPKLTQN